MSTKTIQNIIVKYLTNSANANELDVLNTWIEDASNQKIFKEFVKTHYAIIIGMNDPNPEEIKKRLQIEIRTNNIFFRRKRFKSFLKYAAIAILFISVGYFLTNIESATKEVEPILAGEENITLELENGETILISKEESVKVLNSGGQVVGVQNGGKLVYNNDEINVEKTVYNTLRIPYGKRFDLVLSDGTIVYLNSGSRLKYPIKFLNGEKRHVFLEGEAFFEVSHDEKHPFVVGTEELDVQVLGTKFNLSNYPEDSTTDVVLTNGSVNLDYTAGSDNENSLILKPGFKGSFDKNIKTISSEKVNTALYTSWLNDNLVFREASFNQIIKKLERKYNIIIINNNTELLNETFNATIECDKETIREVFEYFKRIHDIEYQVYENKIIIE